jgi:hypothetical protein
MRGTVKFVQLLEQSIEAVVHTKLRPWSSRLWVGCASGIDPPSTVLTDAHSTRPIHASVLTSQSNHDMHHLKFTNDRVSAEVQDLFGV